MSRRRKRRLEADAPPAPAAASATPTAASTASAAPDSVPVTRAVAACFFLSGFAALLYQVAWLRQFSIVFGTSELAVAAVLAAYMGGLAAGAAAARHLVRRVLRPVRAYALLEGGIAASALAVPVLLQGAGALYVFALGGQPEPPASAGIGQPLFYLAVTFVVLALPTGLMGATLPLLTRHAVRADEQVGPRMAWLYAVNTAGAVAGTLVAAFLLLPLLGLFWTVACGAVTNLVVFVLASALARSEMAEARDRGADGAWLRRDARSSERSLSRFTRAAFEGAVADGRWVLPILFVSGAVSFLYEILWTRLLSHVIGGSIYAFALMLAAFLAGIALGGAAGGILAKRRDLAATWLVAAEVGIAVLAAAVYVWMQQLVPAERNILQFGAYAVAVMLPAAFMIGVTLPLGVRVLAAKAEDAGEATARTYVWNTAGAIVGSIVAGFVLVPRLGFEGAMRLGVSLNLALACAAAVLLLVPRRRLAAALGILTLAVIGFYRPARPDVMIANTAFEVQPVAVEAERYYGVGVSATVYVVEAQGELAIRTNGLPEASVPVAGAPQIGQVQQWLTGLPIAARPEARSLLLIGLGGGSALAGIAESIDDIEVVELEAEVVAANRAIADDRDADPLQDPRVDIVINDARNALRLTDKRYDIIVSQPSHPWTAGASHLYTREFVALSRRHLEENGVFLQWVGAGFVDLSLMQSLTANLVDQFANVRLYQANGSLLFLLASDGALDIERRIAATGQPLRDNVLWYSYMGLNGAEDFAAALVMDETQTRRFSAGAPALTDDRNRMATHSRYLADGFQARELVESLAAYDTLTLDSEAYFDALPGAVDRIAVANRLLRDGFRARVARLAAGLADGPEKTFIMGLLDGVDGRLDAARAAFTAALAQDPSADYARYALLEPMLPEIAAGRADAETTRLAAGFRGSAAAVVRGWELAANGDMRGLAALDRALGAANPRDLWYPESVQLRADWRVRGSDPRALRDAVRLIDRALTIRPRLELLLLRAAAADALDDDPAFIESVRAYLSALRERIENVASPYGPAQAGFAERQILALRAKLDVLGRESPRASHVAESATQILETLARFR